MSAYTTADPIEKRLWEQVKPMLNGCLEFTGLINGDGYGRICYKGEATGTHRVAWELKRGPIPPGMKILHHCDNPPCCETEPSDAYPEGHLFIGTQTENVADMDAKGRRVNPDKKTHCPSRHEYTEENTYVDSDGHQHCRKCRKETMRQYWATHPRPGHVQLSNQYY